MTNTVYSMLWKTAISLIFMLSHYLGETFKIHARNYFKFIGEVSSCLILAASVINESRRWKCLALNSCTCFCKICRSGDLEENF